MQDSKLGTVFIWVVDQPWCQNGWIMAKYFCNKSWGQVPSCELAIFASKSSRRDLVPATSPTNSNQFELLGQVPATCSSELFMWTVHGRSSCNQSLCVNSSEGWLQGLVTSTSLYDASFKITPKNWIQIKIQLSLLHITSSEEWE